MENGVEILVILEREESCGSRTRLYRFISWGHCTDRHRYFTSRSKLKWYQKISAVCFPIFSVQTVIIVAYLSVTFARKLFLLFQALIFLETIHCKYSGFSCLFLQMALKWVPFHFTWINQGLYKSHWSQQRT